MTAVWAADATHVYAGGTTYNGDGYLYLKDASGWHLVWSDFYAGVTGIWGTSASDVWVLEGGMSAEDKLNHWNGQRWSHDANRFLYGVTADAKAMWGASPTDVWLGTSSAFYHFDGAKWTPQTLPTAGHVVAIWAASASQGWAVTDQPCEVLVFQSGAWKSTTLPSCSGVKLTEVWGTGAGDVWVGGGTNERSGQLAHWDGSAWTWVFVPLDSPVTSIAGAGSQVWVADFGDLLRKGP
jgi:hypothetical protein